LQKGDAVSLSAKGTAGKGEERRGKRGPKLVLPVGDRKREKQSAYGTVRSSLS
jgi:hypothetical protein